MWRSVRRLQQRLTDTPPDRHRPGVAVAGAGSQPSALATDSPAFWGVSEGTRARTSVDTNLLTTIGKAFNLTLPNPEDHLAWEMGNFDTSALAAMGTPKLLEFLLNSSPAMSRAASDFLRMSNGGWEYRALDLNDPERKATHREGQKVLDDFQQRLYDLHGTMDVVVNRMDLGAYARGAYCSELVMDGEVAYDVGVPDPVTVRFKAFPHPITRFVWRPYQWQQGQEVYLDIPTFKYIPVDPFPGSPYGRSMIAPAVFVTIFLMGVLHAGRRVLDQNGWPRLDLSISSEILNKSIPPQLRDKPAEIKRWMDKSVKDIASSFEDLPPTHAFVHMDTVTVNRPQGGLDNSALAAIDGIIKLLERQLVQGLKTMPLLLGINETVSETHAARQWEIYVQTIKSGQHPAESRWESMGDWALRSQGIAGARTRMRFAELRKSEELRDQQTDQLKVQNVAYKYYMGWISQDQAAQEGAGVQKAAETEPLAVPRQFAPDQPGVQNDTPGQESPASATPDNPTKKGEPKKTGRDFDPDAGWWLRIVPKSEVPAEHLNGKADDALSPV